MWKPITGGRDNSQVGAQSVAPLGNGVAWFVGGNSALRASGGMFQTPRNACCHLFGMAANDPSDLWFVGERALLMHYDGTRYHLDQSLTRLIDLDALDGDRPVALYGIWRSPPIVDPIIDSTTTDLWAVGAKGMVWRRDTPPGLGPAHLRNSPWEAIPVPPSAREARLLDVWGASADQLWVVGLTGDVDHGPAFGVLLEWDGTRLFEPTITNRPDRLGGLRALAGSGPDDVWAVGRGDELYHFDGRVWSAHPLGESLNLNHATSTGPGRILAGGAPDTFFSGACFGLLVDVDLARPDPIRIHRLGADEPVLASWASGSRADGSGALPPTSPDDPAGSALGIGIAFDSQYRPWLAVDDTWKPLDARWLNASLRSESRLVSDGKHLWLLGLDGSAFKSPPIGTDLLTPPR